ncbi:hypothetical protein BH18PSE1_BH18PSE1_10940 [soil metagenome]
MTRCVLAVHCPFSAQPPQALFQYCLFFSVWEVRPQVRICPAGQR